MELKWTYDPSELHINADYLVEAMAMHPNHKAAYYILRWGGEDFIDDRDQPLGRHWERALLTSEIEKI